MLEENQELTILKTMMNLFKCRIFLICCRLASPSLIQPYCWLLKFYKENKEATNHAIIKMLHRVAVDLKTPSMLFQLSLFRTFQKILSDPAANQYKVRLGLVYARILQESAHVFFFRFGFPSIRKHNSLADDGDGDVMTTVMTMIMIM